MIYPVIMQIFYQKECKWHKLVDSQLVIKIVYNQGRSQGPDFGGGASSFKECRAPSPPGKFKILYRVSEILKNRGSLILEVWARRIYETIKLIENRKDSFSNSLFALDWKCE